jgi:peptidoglycan/LPS O-acetylase OafA/YrhL
VSGPTPVAKPALTSVVAGDGYYLRQFDLFRTVACIGVVAQHSVLWTVPASSAVGWGLVMVLHATREMFFFLSAFVACYSQRTRPRSRGALWYRRLSQILVPYLVWTAIYFAYTMITTPASHGSAIGVLWTDLWHGYYQLYFIVVLVQLYMLLPVLLWLVRATRNHHGWVLGASVALQLAMVTVSHYFSWHGGVLGTVRHVDVVLLTSRCIVGYQLYLVAGLLAATHVDEVQRLVARNCRRILAGSLAVFLVAVGYYLYGVVIGQTPGEASDLYQPVAVVWFMAATAGLYALGWLWASRAARRSPNRVDRLFTWGSDASGGFYLAHVLVLQLVLTGLGAIGLRAATSWGVVSAVLFVATVAGTALLVGVLLRTPLRFVLTGPNRTDERDSLDWLPPPSRPNPPGPLVTDGRRAMSSAPVAAG